MQTKDAPPAFPAGLLLRVTVDGITYSLQLQARTPHGAPPLDAPGFQPLAFGDADALHGDAHQPGASGGSAAAGTAGSSAPAATGVTHSKSGLLRDRLSRHGSGSGHSGGGDSHSHGHSDGDGAAGQGARTSGASSVLMQPSILHPAKLVVVGMGSDDLLKALKNVISNARQELERKGIVVDKGSLPTSDPHPSPDGEKVPFVLHVAPGKSNALGFRFGFPLEDGRYVRPPTDRSRMVGIIARERCEGSLPNGLERVRAS